MTSSAKKEEELRHFDALQKKLKVEWETVTDSARRSRAE